MNKAIRTGLVMSAALYAGIAGAQGDIAAGKVKSETCVGCHGIPGYSNVYPTYQVPRLGGQHAEYLIAAMQAYKSGQRDHETMTANIAGLSDQDIADIAAYFASIK